MEKDKENWEDLDSLFSCGIEDERSWWICLQIFYIPCQTKTQICRSRLGAWMESFSSLTATISSAADASMATPTRGFLQVFLPHAHASIYVSAISPVMRILELFFRTEFSLIKAAEMLQIFHFLKKLLCFHDGSLLCMSSDGSSGLCFNIYI